MAKLKVTRLLVGRFDAWPLLTGGSLMVAVVRGTGSSGSNDVVLTAVQFGLLLLGLLVLWRTEAQQRPAWTHLLPLIFGLLCVASALWSQAPGVTLSRALVFLLILLFIFETVRIRWVDLSLISRDMVLLFWGAVALSALGLSLAIWDVPGMWGEYNRFKGFTPNATVAAWIATFVFPIGYARAFTVTGQARNWLVIGTAILGIAVIASGTRGALLALLGTVVLVHVIRKSHWAVGSGVSAVLIFAIGLAFNLFGTRPSEALDTNPSEASRPSLLEGLAGRVPEPSTDISSGRLDLWETGLGFWADKPLIGWGFGATDSLKGLSGTSLHNAYLTTLVETGVLGLALLAALLFWVFFWQVRPDAGIIAAGAAVLVNAALASSLVNLGSPLTLGAWLVLGALLAAGRRAAQAPQLGATSLVGVPTPSPG